MKKIVLGGVLMLLFIAITSLVPAEKVKYTSDEGKLSVFFPSEFTSSVQSEDSYKTVKTQALSNDVVFFVAYTLHEEDVSNGLELSKVSLDAFTEALQVTDIKESPWFMLKEEGLKATFKNTVSNLTGEYRVVIIGQTQYQITAVGPAEKWNQKVVDKFMKSFKVKK